MIYILLFILSVSLTFLVRKIALKKVLLAEVNDRSSHTTPTPHGGGIAIAITWFSGISYLYYLGDIDSSLYYAFLVGIVISLVSYLDDLYELSPKLRLLVQFIVAISGVYLIGGVSEIDFTFFTLSNQLILNSLTVLIIVWFINLYNFLDGIDGYAGSEIVFLSLAGFILFEESHFLVLIAASLGFLLWNWHKAKIFMGDVGSTLLGYNVAIYMLYYTNQESSNLWIWLILFGVFWFDASVTIFRRFKNKEKLFQAHKKHAYQRLEQSGISHDGIVIRAMLLNIVLFSFIYFIPSLFLSFLISLVVLYTSLKYVDRLKGFS